MSSGPHDFSTALEMGVPFVVAPVDACDYLTQAGERAGWAERQTAEFVDGPLAGSFVVAGTNGELPAEWTVHDSDGAGGVTSTGYGLIVLGERAAQYRPGASEPIRRNGPPLELVFGYVECSTTTQPGAPELSTAIDPTLGQRFMEAGNAAAAAVLAGEPSAENADNLPLSDVIADLSAGAELSDWGPRAAADYAARHADDFADDPPEPEPVNVYGNPATSNAHPGITATVAGVDPRRFIPCEQCHGAGSVVVRDATAELRRQGYPYTVTGTCGACLGGGGLIISTADIG